MIEKIVYNHLRENLLQKVAFEIPKDETNFVIIEKIGSSEENYIKTSRFALQSYGESLLKTVELNEIVKKIMLGLVLKNEISKVSIDGDYNFTDTQTKKYRYQAIFDIVHF